MNDLERIDAALIALRHLWSAPPQIEDPALGEVEMSTIWVVDCLRRTPDQTVSDLADAMGVAHSTASRLVQRAEHSGAVVRAQDARDQRRTTVHSTEAGRALAQTALRFRLAKLEQFTDDWATTDRRMFATLLTRFAAGKDNS
ncbi:MAG: MarR family transcriptional regulator [Candidatus Nanopelagicales bacterium]